MVYKKAKSFRDIVNLYIPIDQSLGTAFNKSGYSDKDIRGSIFLILKKQINMLVMIHNILLCVEEDVIKPKDYRTIFGISNPNDMNDAGNKLSKFTRLSLVTILQFQLENLFVNILSNFEPEKKHRGYGNIVCKLFKHITISNKDDKIETLNVLQYIRNSLHSNGIHNNDTLTKTIDGYTFEFIKSQKVEGVGLDSISIVINVVIKIVEEIIKSPEIKNITTTISDQYVEP